MTNTKPLAPTDAEIETLWQDSHPNRFEAISFARAVLAKWGTLRAEKIVIPTETMEQEFQKHYQRGYVAGQKASATQPTQTADSQPAPVQDYLPLPDFDTVEQHIYGACRRYITQDMLEPIHNLIRETVDATAQPASKEQTMAEPTNDEIDALVAAYLGDCGPQATRVYSFVRSVLAKWGTPPAVAGEPYGYLFTAQEATIVGDERKSMREVFTRKKPPCASVALYTTPQPTKAQAGAVPFTKAQRERLFQNRRLASEKNMGVKLTAAEWHRIVRYIETAHGIKGGQQ